MNKKLLLFLCLVLSVFVQVYAQAPQQINYQAVVRNSSGQPLPAGSNVTVRFRIHDGTPTGPVVFQETNTAVTNQFGLITNNRRQHQPGHC